MDFQAIRKEYENRGIDESGLPDCPIELLKQWYKLAVDQCPGKWFEPNVMALATSDLKGKVTNRFVLMKHISQEGIQFFTNYESSKGKQLKENPYCAVAIHWPYLGRQIRMEGSVAKTPREVSQEYFRSRPRGSQIGASISRQSASVESRNELDRDKARMDEQYDGKDIPLPDDWGGYQLSVASIEFWQGRLDRLHDRIRYNRNGSDWSKMRLSP